MKYNRLQELKAIILKERRIEVMDIVSRMNVSVETIRRDLTVLEKEGFIKKVYGGAELLDDNIMPQRLDAWEKRLQVAKNEKKRMAERVIGVIPDNSVIAMDSGTTMYCVARQLNKKHNMTVVSNSLYNITEVSSNSDNLVYCIGGAVKKGESITTGFIASNFINYFSKFDIAIISSDGMNLQDGFTDYSMDMCLVKREFLKKSEKIILLVDHTKYGINAGYKTCDFEDVDVFITDKQTPPEILEAFHKEKTEIIIV